VPFTTAMSWSRLACALARHALYLASGTDMVAPTLSAWASSKEWALSQDVTALLYRSCAQSSVPGRSVVVAQAPRLSTAASSSRGDIAPPSAEGTLGAARRAWPQLGRLSPRGRREQTSGGNRQFYFALAYFCVSLSRAARAFATASACLGGTGMSSAFSAVNSCNASRSSRAVGSMGEILPPASAPCGRELAVPKGDCTSACSARLPAGRGPRMRCPWQLVRDTLSPNPKIRCPQRRPAVLDAGPGGQLLQFPVLGRVARLFLFVQGSQGAAVGPLGALGLASDSGALGGLVQRAQPRAGLPPRRPRLFQRLARLQQAVLRVAVRPLPRHVQRPRAATF